MAQANNGPTAQESEQESQRTLRITVQNASAWLKYNADYRVLFCEHHGYAIRNLATHLRDHHAGSIAEKKAVTKQYSTLSVARPADVKNPPPLAEPFSELGLPTKGWKCDEDGCEFISINRNVVRQHCHGHGWRQAKGSKTHWHAVWVQCFFPSGGLRRYFIVNYSGAEEEQTERVGDADQRGVLEAWDAAEKTHGAKMDIVAEEVAKQDKTLWWKKTGWQEHLKGCNLRHLSSASRLPDADEAELEQARKAVHELVETCVRGLRTLDNEMLRWVRSAKRAEPDVRPLGRLQNAESQKRYADYIARFVCYSLRVLRSIGGRREGEEEGEEGEADAEQEEEQEAEQDGKAASSGDESSDDGPPGGAAAFDTMKDARRLFPWHGEQKGLAGMLWEALSEGRAPEEQVRMLHGFLQSVIYQPVRGDNFRSPLLHFLAVLSINEEMGRLREAKDFSYMLAGIVYCVRVLTVEDVLPSRARDVQGELDDERFLETRLKHLADGGFSPMSKMLSLLAYGKHIGLNHQNSGSLFWDHDEAVLFRGRRIVMADFRSMLHRVITAAEDLLWGDLLWTPGGRFAIALDDLVDDVTYAKRGFWFADEPSNRLQNTRGWVLERMAAHPQGRKMRRNGRWQERQVRKYLRAVDSFRELLLFCVHVTGGQPGRGTEVTAIRFKNGFLQDRNIFVIRGQMVVVTRYHKSASQLDKPKVIPRFLPWRVGQLLAVYLAYVQGLAAYLRVEMGGTGLSEHLWENEKGLWETDRLTKVLRSRTQEHLGTGLTTLEYRHVAIFIGRKVVGEVFARGCREENEDVEEAEEGDDDPLEMSAGRGGEIGANRYGVSMEIIKHLSSRTLEVFRPLSEGWHVFLGLQSLGASRKRGREEMDEGRQAQLMARNGISNWGAAMKRLRAGPHDSGPTTPPTSSPLAAEGVRFGSSQAGLSSSRGAPTSDGVEMDLRRVVSEAEVKRALGKALGQETVEFRSQEQRQSLLSVVNTDGRTPLVVVLPTGGGKSMLFTVPACLDDPGVTVVVVPFRALLNNLLEKAKASGIECGEWRSGSSQRSTLTFVSADNVSGTGFIGHMKQWEQRGLLRRVFVDEAHLAFKDNHWRAKLAGLRELRASRCPLIMMTATLPPQLETELEGFMAAQYARYIRRSTVRARTRYIVETVKRGAVWERAVELCRSAQARLGRKRGIVYCRSRDQCRKMAEELGVMHFMGQLADNPERLEHWLAANGLIVATSALGTGVDFEKIVFTLHVDLPYGMIDFAQESGRGGRAGEDVDSLVVCEVGSADRLHRQGRGVDERAMAGFALTQGCRRKVMSTFLDGQEVSCGAGELARCDNCGEGITALEREYKREAYERRLFEGMMDDLVDFCAVCWLDNAAEHESWEHSAIECSAGRSEAENDAFRGQLRFDDDTHSCFKCGISQRLCSTRTDSKQTCQWPGRVGPLLQVIVEQEDKRHMLRDCGYEGGEGEGVGHMEWLGRRHPRRIWGEVMSNGMAVLIRAVVQGQEGAKAAEEVEDEGDDGTESEALASSPPIDRSDEDVEEEEAEQQLISLLSEDFSEDYEPVGGFGRVSEELEPPGKIGRALELECYEELSNVRLDEPQSEEEERVKGELHVRTGPTVTGELKRLLARWQGRCSICLVEGRDGVGHASWWRCPDDQRRSEVKRYREALNRIQYRYSACARCHAPQAVCQAWIGETRHGRVYYRHDRRIECQFPDVIRDVGAAIWALKRGEGVGSWLEEQIRLRGIDLSGDKENSGITVVKEYFGQQFREDGIELSGLCRMVWRFGPEE